MNENQDSAATPHSDPAPNGIKDLFQYPLMAAIRERRTRRICRGTSFKAGPLSYTSSNEPIPLSPLEEAILIVSVAGITGDAMSDAPLRSADGGEQFGTPLLKVLARSGSSPDNCQATSFFMINDEGIWLIRNPNLQETLEILSKVPERWEEWSEEDWIQTAAAFKVKVQDERMSFPRHFPYYLAWNGQISNVPGSTVFFPVVDLTRQYINALLSIASEPDGERPLFIDDWQKFRPRSFIDWIAWAGSKLGITDNVAYQPIGGIKRVRSGFVNPENIVPLGYLHTLRTDFGAFFLLQNLMLIAHGMGLGGWIHAAIFAPYIFQRDPEKEWYGLGFRMEPPKKDWGRRRWPPLPTTQPNPVGIDGVLEALCPPYVSSMDEAVDRIIEEKFGSDGPMYGNPSVFARPYRKPEYGEEYNRTASRFSEESVAYAKEICNYVYDTYGRFPGHVEAFYAPGVWLQISHLEMEYYDKFFQSKLYHRQARHNEIWGKH